jgi:predicted XRE-type DNA-binding protein
MTQRFRSVWDALEDNPKDAANMRLRAALMRALQKHLRDHKLTQNDAAILFGVSCWQTWPLKRSWTSEFRFEKRRSPTGDLSDPDGGACGCFFSRRLCSS